jgi:hypothetical protein
VSLLFVLALAAARVESVGLTMAQSQLGLRVVVSGTPGIVAVHRDGRAARVSIADAELGLRFAGGHRFTWTPEGIERDRLGRSPARIERLELAATPSSEVSLLLELPPDASIDVQRDARGLLILFRPPPPSLPAVPSSTVSLPAAPAAPPSVSPPPSAVAPAAPAAPPSPPPAAPSRVTADLARALYPGGQAAPAGGQAEAAGEAEGPPKGGEGAPPADLYARLFPSGPPSTTAEPAVASEAAAAAEDSSLVFGPFRVRAGVDARYVDADTFVDSSAQTTRDRFLEVAPHVEAETPVGAGRFQLEYAPWLRALATYDQVDSSTHVARADLDLPTSGSVALHASDRFVVGTLDTRYADPGGEYFFGLGRFHRNDAEVGATIAVGPRTSLELAGTASFVRFTETSSFFDYDTRRVSAGIGYELTPNLRVAGDYAYDAVPRPDERPEAEARGHEAGLTLRGDILPLLTGELAVAYRSQTNPNAGPGGTHYGGLTWSGSLQRRLSPDAALGIFLSRTTPVSAFEENGFYVSTWIQGTLVMPLPLELQLDGALGYRWNDYRTIAAGTDAPRADRILDWAVGLRRPIGRRLYLSGMYRAEERRSNLDQFVVDSDGFYIQLEWKPLGPVLR